MSHGGATTRGGGQSGTGLRARTRRRLSLGATCVALALTPASAWATRIAELDPDTTRITFRLGTTLHTVEGSFRLESGRIEFDPAGGPASGLFVVDARSGDSGSSLRDRRMHEQVLESDTYAEIAFAARDLSVVAIDGGSAKVRLSGSLSVHGAQHPLAIDGTVRVTRQKAHLQASFTVPFVEWGMADMSSLLLRVDPTVAVDIDAEATLSER